MVVSNALSSSSLRRVVRMGDSARFQVNLAKEREAIVEEIAEDALAGEVDLATFGKSKIKGRSCISYTQYDSNLVLRSISSHIARRFRVKSHSRELIVDGVIEALIESTPMFIIRRDIKSFYETVPTEEVRKRLIYDTAIPRTTRHYLRMFFDHHCKDSTFGLPRGVGLSSVLVELAMEGFDKKVRALDGVYKYFRYSDDILIFTFKEPKPIEQSLSEILPAPMTYNTNKFETITLVNRDKKQAKSKSLDYLGYKFVVSDFCDAKKARCVDVHLSKRKVSKLKTRIVLALNDYLITRNAVLLCQRMEFLSGNYKLRRMGSTVVRNSNLVLSGSYYSYRHCGTHSSDGYKECTPPELHIVNRFYHNLIRNKHHRYRTQLLKYTNHLQMDRLLKISFPHGFSSKMSIKLGYDRFRTVTSVWQNVK